jgi:hypothetical protein
MKVIISLFVAACLTSGCIGPGSIRHADSPGVVKRDQGPVLCHDGSTPPCNDRD